MAEERRADMSDKPQIIVGVPGTWPSRTALVQSIAGESGGYLFASRILMNIDLMNIETKHSWEMEVYEQDPNLARTFALAGRGSVTEEDLRAVAAHTCACYLIGEGGSVEAAQRMMDAACGLLRAGGVAVKVESAGKAHSARDWTDLAARREPRALYDAYVTLIGGDGGGYSCGMHNLGLPDAAHDAALSDKEGARLLQTFLLYTLLETPDLQSGHSFSLNPQSPHHRLRLEPCGMYEKADLFFNPYGLWRLEPA